MSTTVVVLSKDRTVEYERHKNVQLVEFITTVVPEKKSRVTIKDNTGTIHTYNADIYDVVTLDL